MDPKYEAIINLPHHVSQTHPHMPMKQRAAQFAPFAALSGHEEMMNEQHRYVEERPAMFDDEVDEINRQIMMLQQKPNDTVKICVKYYVKDKSKPGGICRMEDITVHRINLTDKCIESTDGKKYYFKNVLGIDDKNNL